MAGLTYVLIVAIEDYLQPKHFRKIKYAVKDAEELKLALLLGGIEEDEITLLLNGNATQTAIRQEIQKIAKKATEADRIIFYFSGHGAFDSGENYLLPFDCYNDNISGTAVSINHLLGILKKCLCKKNILFLDCCHSGFEPGDDTKSTDKSFLADELVYSLREEEYTVGFASCMSNQTSITHPKLQHSVWTYFLIQALKGDAEKIYEHGILLSDKLQSYLNTMTREYVKLNTDDKKDQVPIIFGNQTNKFVIADLNPLFEERERNREVDEISLVNIAIIREERGSVKTLPGFSKKVHFVPTYKNSKTEGFIQEAGNSIIEEEISDLSKEIRSKLFYKLREVQANSRDGSGTINTPDFTYTMQIKQSTAIPSEYNLIRKLINFKNSKVVLTPEFNEIFAGYFQKLKLSLNKKIDIEKFITNFEDLEDITNIKIEYDPSNLSYCNLFIDGVDQKIVLTSQSINLVFDYLTRPENLISTYKEVHRLLLAAPHLKLLD